MQVINILSSIRLMMLFCGVILFVGCISNKEPPFVIESEKFAASEVCDAEGVYELQMEKGDLTIKAREDIQINMIRDGVPSPWCHGLTHIFLGEVHYGGYIFDSSSDDPLQFVVDRDKGYYYKEGTGEVTKPEGEIVELPSMKVTLDKETRVESKEVVLAQIKGLLVDLETGHPIQVNNIFREYLDTDNEADRVKITEYMKKAVLETDEDGSFHFRGLPPGHYRLLSRSNFVGPKIIVSQGETIDLGVIEVQK